MWCEAEFDNSVQLSAGMADATGRNRCGAIAGLSDGAIPVDASSALAAAPSGALGLAYGDGRVSRLLGWGAAGGDAAAGVVCRGGVRSGGGGGLGGADDGGMHAVSDWVGRGDLDVREPGRLQARAVFGEGQCAGNARTGADLRSGFQLTERSLALVQGPGQLPVGVPGSLQFGFALLQGCPQTYGLLFQAGDRPLDCIDVCGCAEARLLPDPLSQRLGQTSLQLLDTGGEPGSTRFSVGEVGLERGAADGRGGC